ncbi:MAG: hypothetical protein KBS86_03975 [Proteobacteria bacterium]|nr:hypothetical protein [Candidatus Enterousia scatequi]
MTQKLFLTSAIAMGFVAPAFADPTYTDAFPDDGYMQEDYTYTNAATADNMDDVYEGTVNAVAEYDIVDYILSAGQYLPADSETPTTCPAGSFCSGIGEVQYNETSAQGIATCPTGFGSSAAGATSANECYRQCSGNVEIEHATGVTGNDYYGTGIDTCEPTGCVNGWHIKAGLNLADTIGNESGSYDYASIDNTGYLSYAGMNSGVVHDAAFFNLNTNNHNTWATYYNNGKGMLMGQGRCSTQAGSNGWYTDGQYDDNGDWSNTTKVSSLTDETGQEGAKYCYCNVTGYTPDGGTLQSLSSPWVFYHNYGGDCAVVCTGQCVYYMRVTDSRYLAFRAALLGSVQPTPAMCEANTITINWSNADAEDISANNAGTATYGSDVRTPVKAETIKGKTFKGWKFSKPTTTQLP